MDTKEIRAFVDSEGRLTALPTKRRKKIIALCMLAERIPTDISCTEREFNGILNGLHTFGDPATLRRELYDHFLIDRSPDGSIYTVPPVRPAAEELIARFCDGDKA